MLKNVNSRAESSVTPPNLNKKHLVWFRRDLRVADNKALFAACEDTDAEVAALFTATPQQWHQHGVAEQQIAFIHAHLKTLKQELATLGIPLMVYTCDTYEQAAQWVSGICLEENASALFFNNEYEINERERDRQLFKLLSGKVHIHAFDDSLLIPPGMIRNLQGHMYKVFTPFRQTALKILTKRDSHCFPRPKKRNEALNLSHPSQDLFDCEAFKLEKMYPVGEQQAILRLRQFCQADGGAVNDYADNRDIPSIDGTSGLSAYLAIGVLSVRQCFNCLLLDHPQTLQQTKSGPFVWLSELLWREFYHHLIFAFPRLCCYQPFIEWTNQIKWDNNEQHFDAWKEGQTGFPIVDAAMRQLKKTGWMHNRLRMIVASFLVKDLLIDWRKGEQYFMSQLMDGCFAANNGGWQWSASTGTDASPWFRIFNPTTQGKKFDPQGLFIRRWLPELKDVPDSHIHTPHQWVNHEQLNYPFPIVEHDQARKKTLEVFKAAQMMK